MKWSHFRTGVFGVVLLVLLLCSSCASPFSKASTSQSAQAQESSYLTGGSNSLDGKTLRDACFVLGGSYYQLPMSVTDLKALGWELEEFNYPNVNGGSISSGTVYNTALNMRASAVVRNYDEKNTDKSIPVDDCTVISLCFSTRSDSNFSWPATGAELLLPDGIQFGVSTIDEIKGAYGEPIKEGEYAGGQGLRYATFFDVEGYTSSDAMVHISFVSFTFVPETGQVTDYRVRNDPA